MLRGLRIKQKSGGCVYSTFMLFRLAITTNTCHFMTRFLITLVPTFGLLGDTLFVITWVTFVLYDHWPLWQQGIVCAFTWNGFSSTPEKPYQWLNCASSALFEIYYLLRFTYMASKLYMHFCGLNRSECKKLPPGNVGTMEVLWCHIDWPFDCLCLRASRLAANSLHLIHRFLPVRL